MEHFLPFFITLFAGLVFSTTFKRVQIPWVVALILAGVVIGSNGLNLFQVNETVEFISQSGLVLMMFMAGLESQVSSIKDMKNKVYLVAILNGFVPFLVGLILMLAFGFELDQALLIGIIFISSSVAVVIPSLESLELIKTPLGSTVLSTSIIQDVASLVVLSLFLQTEDNIANLPLLLFYPMVLLIVLATRILLPKVQKMLFKRAFKENDIFQRDLRAVLLILFGVVILFELLGLHAIIGGFFTGLVLSESLKSKILLGKIRAISYGIFIPTFFIVVGMQTDLSQLWMAQDSLIITAAIVIASIASKLLSGTLAAKLVGFNWSQASFFGVTSVPQLSTTLAAAYTGFQLGVLSPQLVTAAVVLSVVTTIIAPISMAGVGSFVLSKKDIKKAH